MNEPLVWKSWNGRLTIQWPDPMPTTVTISADLFAEMIREINAARDTERRGSG